MTAEYERLRGEIEKGHDTFLGDYAATDETEFFSVASECFYTLPIELHEDHPALYDILAEYYRVDPRKWFAKRDP